MITADQKKEIIEKYCSFMPVNIYLSKEGAEQEYETIDADIAELEEKIAAIDVAMGEAVSDYNKLTELSTEKEELEQQLEEKMDRWVYLNDLAERIENAK